MSLFTSRSRSGFDFSVCTPCAVRLESRMYVATSPPPRSGTGLYSPCGLIEVQESGNEEEERREDDVGKEEREPFRSIRGPVQEQDQDDLRDAEDDHDRRQCAESVRGSGATEAERA